MSASAISPAAPIIAYPKGAVKKFITNIDGTTADCQVLDKFVESEFVNRITQLCFFRDDEVLGKIFAITHRHQLKGSPSYIAEKILSWKNDPTKQSDRSYKELRAIVFLSYFIRQNLAPIFKDVPKMFKAWKEAGIGVSSFSYRTKQEQQLLFGNNDCVNVSPFMEKHFVCTKDPKTNPGSYLELAKRLNTLPGEILFASNRDEELQAAMLAGLKVVRVNRTGQSIPESKEYPTVTSLDQIDLK